MLWAVYHHERKKYLYIRLNFYQVIQKNNFLFNILFQVVEKMRYRGGESMLGRALAVVHQRAWVGHVTGARRSVPKTLLVITDGASKDEFQSMAATMRDKEFFE